MPSPLVRVEASAAIELSWLLIACKHRDAVHSLPPDLLAQVDGFWQDGFPMLTELLVTAQRRGCVTGWDITPLLDPERHDPDPDAPFDLSTESEDERDRVRQRLARLARDPALRRRYASVLEAAWTEACGELETIGKPTIDAAVASYRASLNHGAAPLDLIPDSHIARRAPHLATTSAAAASGQLLLTPCYSAGGHGHVVALPGVCSVAIGTGVSRDVAAKRAAADRVARGLKLLSDPTRVLILLELDRDPASVGAIARRVGIAQPTASTHLRQLREAGLVRGTRDGATVAYRVERDQLGGLLEDARQDLLTTTA
jgi:ArsR family transcriptional regulator, zinc-responsive transcriptional repressor